MANLLKHTCERCAHKTPDGRKFRWIARVKNPKRCPNCGSFVWRKPKKPKKG